HLVGRQGGTGKLLCRPRRYARRCAGLGGPLVHFFPVDEGVVAAADKHVLCNSKIGAEGNFLVDGTHAEVLGILRRSELDCLAFDVNLARVFLVDPGHDLDECRLACSVLAHKSVNFSLAKGKADVVQGPNAGKGFAYTLHLKHDLVLQWGSLLTRTAMPRAGNESERSIAAELRRFFQISETFLA